MCKPVLVVGLVCLSATLALAQGKVDNGWACGKPAMANSIEVGDQPNHAYAIDQIKCTSTKGEIAGVKEKEGTGTEFAEVTGNSAKGHGVLVETMANGDKSTPPTSPPSPSRMARCNLVVTSGRSPVEPGNSKASRAAAPAREREARTDPRIGPALALTRFPSRVAVAETQGLFGGSVSPW